MKLKMTTWKIAFTLSLFGTMFYFANLYWPRSATEVVLVKQLEGQHCRFTYQMDTCEQRGFEPFRSLLLEDHDCDIWAIQCLSKFKSPLAVKAMIDVLSSKNDVETCDGVRPVRTLAVEYLGNSDDRSAIEPLRKLLASNPMEVLSAGASGCQPRPENLDNIRAALKKLE